MDSGGEGQIWKDFLKGTQQWFLLSRWLKRTHTPLVGVFSGTPPLSVIIKVIWPLIDLSSTLIVRRAITFFSSHSSRTGRLVRKKECKKHKSDGKHFVFCLFIFPVLEYIPTVFSIIDFLGAVSSLFVPVLMCEQ